TGIMALAFVGPTNAPAATINIFDFSPNDVGDPSFNVAGFTASSVLQQIAEVPSNGVLTISGIYVAANPLPPGVSQTVNFNMNDPVDEGPICCSDTLSIPLAGRAADNGNMMTLVDFRSGFPAQVNPLPTGVPTGEIVNFSAFGLEVNAFSVAPTPGPIVGAGLPGLILACGVLLALARRRRQLVA